jgi:hypothetical protein
MKLAKETREDVSRPSMSPELGDGLKDGYQAVTVGEEAERQVTYTDRLELPRMTGNLPLIKH